MHRVKRVPHSNINPMSIRLARVQRGVSLSKLALAAKISAQHLSLIERSLSPLTQDMANRLIQGLAMYGITLESNDDVIITK